MNIINILFECSHEWSRVWTLAPIRRQARRDFPEMRGPKRTYQTCLKCGAERDYDWKALGQTESSTGLVEREAEV